MNKYVSLTLICLLLILSLAWFICLADPWTFQSSVLPSLGFRKPTLHAAIWRFTWLCIIYSAALPTMIYQNIRLKWYLKSFDIHCKKTIQPITHIFSTCTSIVLRKKKPTHKWTYIAIDSLSIVSWDDEGQT